MRKLFLLSLILLLTNGCFDEANNSNDLQPTDSDSDCTTCATDCDCHELNPTDGDPDNEAVPENEEASEAEQADEDSTPECTCRGVNKCCDGCNAMNDGTPCEDHNQCSLASECAAGACATTASLDCRSENPCVESLCVPDVGCVFHELETGFEFTGPDGALYQCVGTEAVQICHTNDDCTYLEPTGNPCVTEYECIGLGVTRGGGGPCVPKFRNGESCGEHQFCDGWQCLTEECQCGEDTECCDGCHLRNTGEICSGNYCIESGFCGNTGQCEALVYTTCPDDGNPCTVEACDPNTGCTSHTRNDWDEFVNSQTGLVSVCLHDAMYPTCNINTGCSDQNQECKSVLVSCDDDGAGQLSCQTKNLCLPKCETENQCVNVAFDVRSGGCDIFFWNEDMTCDDGLGCTDGDYCEGGYCQSGQIAPCEGTDRPVCVELNAEGYYCDGCDTDMECDEGEICHEHQCKVPVLMFTLNALPSQVLVIGSTQKVLDFNLVNGYDFEQVTNTIQVACESNCLTSGTPVQIWKETTHMLVDVGELLEFPEPKYKADLSFDLDFPAGTSYRFSLRLDVPTTCEPEGSYLRCSVTQAFNHDGQPVINGTLSGPTLVH